MAAGLVVRNYKRYYGTVMNSLQHSIMVEFVELPPNDQLERDWLALEAHSDTSFFTSWSWVGCWIACLPAYVKPRLLRAVSGKEVVGLGLLVSYNFRRHRFLPVKGLFLHRTGDPQFDEITIEHNGFLADRAMSSAIVTQLFKYLVSNDGDWEELHLDGVAEIIISQLPVLTCLRVKRRLQCNYYVDLDEVRAADGDYLSLLGQNTRYNIRRSIKEYAKHGPMTLTVADNLDQAFEFIACLKDLHQKYWQSRGMPGAFANTYFESFHERLIRTRFSSGEIQLIRINVGDRIMGYLYNLVQRGQVYNYQSGFDYTICEKKNRPGLVAHSLAIEYNASRGHTIYDLLAGDSDYKIALSTHTSGMEWIVIQRDLIKFRIEDGLSHIKHWLSYKTSR
jgi:CelD/BcsL family acetyltransferase involved in cellulose biosynthesis